MPTRNVNLSPQQTAFIRKIIKSGQYQNASEVVRAGLHLLQQQSETEKLKLARLRGLVQEGFGQIDRGEYEVITDQTLGSFLKSVSARRRRAKSA